MNSYICLCGQTFKTKNIADQHYKLHEDEDFSNGFASHKIFKQHWQARLCEWVLSKDIIYHLSFFAAIIINSIFVAHSSLGWGEGICESICMGFVLVRILQK